MKVKELIKQLLDFPTDADFEMYSESDIQENIELTFGYIRYSNSQNCVIADIEKIRTGVRR